MGKVWEWGNFSFLDLIDQTTCRFSLTPRLFVTYSASFPDCFGTRVEWVGQGIVLKCLWNSAWEAVVWGTTLPTSELVSVVLRMLELQPLFSLHTVNAQQFWQFQKFRFGPLIGKNVLVPYKIQVSSVHYKVSSEAIKILHHKYSPNISSPFWRHCSAGMCRNLIYYRA